MTESDLARRGRPSRRAATPARGTLPSFTMFESSALVLAVVTLLLVYVSLLETGREGRIDHGEIWMLLPHVALIALIVAGLRRVATVVMTFILLAAALIGLLACIDALMHTREMHGLAFAAALQLPLFIIVFRTGRTPFSLTELAAQGTRLALGAVVAVSGWYVSELAVQKAGKPQRELAAQAAATRLRESARRDARAQVAAIASCLQRVPVTPDSQPDFPIALLALPPEDCPEAGRPAPGGYALEYTAGPPDAEGHRRSFRLVAHDLVMTDSAHTWASDESMMLRQWYGLDDRRLSLKSTGALSTMAEIGRCIESARTAADAAGRTSYPASLASLKGKGGCGYVRLTADSSAMIVAAGRYFVRYTPPRGMRPGDAPGGYVLSMEAERDSLGRTVGGPVLSFFSDTSGAIHLTRRARAATESDSVIPACPDYPRRMNGNGPLICSEWMPRQRWGLESQLPTVAWSRSGSGTVGAGDTLFLTPQYQPVVRSDSIVEAHIQWDANRPDSTLRRHAGRIGEQFGSGVSIPLRHVYADTGMKQIRFGLRNGAGEEYGFRDSVRVLLPSRYR